MGSGCATIKRLGTREYGQCPRAMRAVRRRIDTTDDVVRDVGRSGELT